MQRPATTQTNRATGAGTPITTPPAPTSPGRLRRAVQAVADFIVPPVCLVCNDALGSHDTLCGSCWQRISFIHAPLCDRTGQPLPFDPRDDTETAQDIAPSAIISAQAVANPPVYDRARAVAHYSGVMSDMIRGFKYGDRHDARRLFGRWMYAAGHELYADTDWIMPVPLNRLRLWSRRFNQSALLAQEVAALSGIAYEPLALWRPRRTQPQIGKTQEQRRANVAGAFAVAANWQERLRAKNILLIDDVITTGATANACAGTLKRAGANRVDVLVLAKTTGEILDMP